MTRPGAFVESSGVGIPSIRQVSPAQYFSVGLFEWGPVNRPYPVTGLSDLRKHFGENVTYSAAPEHFEAAYRTSNDTLSGWIVRCFETRPSISKTVALPGEVGETIVYMDEVTGLRVGDKIDFSSQGNENHVIAAIDETNGSITLDRPLDYVAPTGAQVYTSESSIDDYKAKCAVKSGSDTVFTLVALDPSALGNTFKTEIAPGGLNKLTDRIVRVRTRGNKAFTFEWKGAGTAPTAVPDPGPNATNDQKAEYQRFVLRNKAFNASLAAAEAHNREVIRQVKAKAIARDIDFVIEIGEIGAAAPVGGGDGGVGVSSFAGQINDFENKAYTTSIDTTQDRIIETRVNDLALEWYGGSNGESLNNLPPYSTQEAIRLATPDSVFIGVFQEDGAYTGLQAFNDELYGTGVVTIPGRDNKTVWNALIEHCESFDRVAMLNIPMGTSPQDALNIKIEFGGSKAASMYYGYGRQGEDPVDYPWIPATAVAMGVGSRETARNDDDGGIKASWTGRVGLYEVEKFYGRDAVTVGVAELFSRQDVNLNYIMNVRQIGYRLESQALSAPEGPITQLYHQIVNNVMVYSIRPSIQFVRDRTIDRTGILVKRFKDAVMTFMDDYGPGKDAPRGNTLWNPAVFADTTTLNDLRNNTLRGNVSYSQSPKARVVMLGLDQEHITL